MKGIYGTRNFFVFMVPPFGVLDIWWVETAKKHTFGVYTFQLVPRFAVKLFPVGCAQDTVNSAVF